MNKPIFQINLDGQAVSLSDRLLTLEITDKSGIESDTLTLTIADPDNALTLPRRGVELSAAIGYEASGLVNKGIYTVDEVEYSSPPNILTITARAANFRNSFREKREESYHRTSLGEILRTLAGRNGLEPIIAGALDTIFVNHIDQTISDAQLFAKLGRLYDAHHSVKSGRMVFLKRGEPKTANGALLPTISIAQNQCTNWRLSMADRDNTMTGIKARYLDRPSGQTATVTAGTDDNTITLPASFSNKTEALSAATAELSRRRRKGKQISITLGMGNPNIIAESPITLSGFKQGVDGSGWVVEEVRHSLTSGGLMSSVMLEAKQ